MKKFISRFWPALALVVLAPSAFAISIFCPDLEGVYRCSGRGQPFTVRIDQDDVWLDARYVFRISGQPEQVFITNQVRTPISSRAGTGHFSARCSDERLQVRWSLVEASGRRLEFLESYFLEGNALVTIRTPLNRANRSLAASQVCRRIR